MSTNREHLNQKASSSAMRTKTTHRRPLSLQQLFYRMFEPRERPEKLRIVRAGSANASFNANFKYADNAIKTSRYNIFTFIPLNLFEQFLRTANIYFLVLVILQCIPAISPVSPMPQGIALACVLAITGTRFGVDDFLRYRSDQRINDRKTNVISSSKSSGIHVEQVKWRSIKVGQVVKLGNNDQIPADLLLLSSSDSNGLCYIETAELDGETNLKYRQAVAQTHSIGSDLEKLASFDGEVQCEAPNNLLARFDGRLIWQGETYSLNNGNVALRGCALRNTEWAFGLVVYTGLQTKVMKNAGKTLYKRTRMEKQSNKYFISILVVMVILLIISAILGSVFESGDGRHFKDAYSLWMPVDGITPALIGCLQFFSYLILVQQLLPITLYTTIEVIQIFLSRGYINADLDMYHQDSDTPAQARSTSLNEDLGQIEYIFSDKTGTLTQNVMTFNKCSIGRKVYGETAADSEVLDFSQHEPKYYETTFKFYDRSLLDDVKQGLPQVEEFFLLVAICHSLNAEFEGDKLTYKAQSPDEAALVTAARNFGYVFKGRNRSSITLEIHGKEVVFPVECVLEFDTIRKRMSVVVVENGRRRLFCKGADSNVLGLVKSDDQTDLVKTTKEHLYEFACQGLRTLCLASRNISDSEWQAWSEKYKLASTALIDREDQLAKCYQEIESGLTLIGATGVEDKLQTGVPEAIYKLSQAGIKIWVLTGDKQETAVNIGQSCKMLTETTEHFTVDADSFAEVEEQLSLAQLKIKQTKLSPSPLSTEAETSFAPLQSVKRKIGAKGRNFALIINGQSLLHALTDELEELFLDVACDCNAVICCRVAPLQKGRVVEVVRRRRLAMTLAIGDGGNDVNMIKSAHIGVGISGQEGRQAVLSSDFALAQFRFLQKLLLVHGRWNYMRMATFLNFFFYKTFAFTLCQFWFGIYCGWSANSIVDQWYITAYTLVYTSSPILYYAAFEQDVNKHYSQTYPNLYLPGLKGHLFSWSTFLLALAEGIFASLETFFIIRYGFSDYSMPDGDPITTSRAALGVALGTTLVILATVRCCVEISYWTFANIWPICSLVAVFLLQFFIAEFLAKYVSKNNEYEYFRIGVSIWGSPNYWLTCLLIVIIDCLPVIFFRFATVTIKPTLLQRVRIRQLLEWKKPMHVLPGQNQVYAATSSGQQQMMVTVTEEQT